MDPFEKFFAQSIKFLSYRPRSEKEVKEKLINKKAPPEIIEKVIAELKAHKFIDDKVFAEWFVGSRSNFRPKAKRIIKMELRQKGIVDNLIDEQDFGNDLETARKLISKKFEKYKLIDKKEIYNKLGSFLARRGYDWDTIKRAIDEQFSK